MTFTIGQNGTEANSVSVDFTSATVLQLAKTSATVVYALTESGNDTGYYSFVFLFTCGLQPVLDVGMHARNLDYTLVTNWLGKSKGVSQACSSSMLDVSMLGFTNTYYNRLSVGFNSS